MKKGAKVLLGVVILIIAVVFATTVVADVLERRRYYKEYRNTLMSLSDSIATLRKDLSEYQKEIEKLDLERDSIRREIQVIFKDNEKIDAILANGDWDYNLMFITDFLSKEDTVSERHHNSTDETTAH